MLDETYEHLIEQCESDVRAGHSHLAAKRLAHLNLAKVPRQWRLRLANVCRRAGLISQGLRLLSPIIHPDRNRWRVDADAFELSEYAVLLQKCGAINEALRTLQRVDSGRVPDSLLYQAFCHFSQWQYHQAIPLLRKYLEMDLAPYARLVGRVNLAAALVATEQLDQALEQLVVNIEMARAGGFTRLEGNSLELSAQIHIRSRNFFAAEKNLDEAARLLGSESTSDQLFVRKWQAVLSGFNAGSAAPIKVFREEALSRGHWESVREADLYILSIEFEKHAFDHLVFGTPFEFYRQRIYRELKTVPDADSMIYGVAGARTLDLLSGQLRDDSRLKAGQAIHRLLNVLLRDLYRPLRVGGLFSELFPHDYFDIHSSPDRVHQILRRTRRWLEQQRIPIVIDEHTGAYRIAFTGDFAFALPLNHPDGGVTQMTVQFEKLAKRYGEAPSFTAREAREELGIPLTSFNRLISWALAAGQVERLGTGAKTQYVIRSANAAAIDDRIAS